MVKLYSSVLIPLAFLFCFNSAAHARTACDIKPESLKRLNLYLNDSCEKLKEGAMIGSAKISLGSAEGANNDLPSLAAAIQDLHGFTIESLDFKYLPSAIGLRGQSAIILPPFPATLSPVYLYLTNASDQMFPQGVFDGDLARTEELNLNLDHPKEFIRNLNKLATELGHLRILAVSSNDFFCTDLGSFFKIPVLSIRVKSVCQPTFLQNFHSLEDFSLATDEVNDFDLQNLQNSQASLKILNLENLKALDFHQLSFPQLSEVHLPGYLDPNLPADWRTFSPSLKIFNVGGAQHLASNPLDTVDFPDSIEIVYLMRSNLTSWQGLKSYPRLTTINLSTSRLLDLPDAPCSLAPKLKLLEFYNTQIRSLKKNVFSQCTSNPFFNFDDVKLELNQSILSEVIESNTQIFLNPLSTEEITFADQIFSSIGWSSSFGSVQENADYVDLTGITVIGPLCRKSDRITSNVYQTLVLSKLKLTEFPLCLKSFQLTDTLDLSRNLIPSIPARIMEGLQVKIINLMENPITSVEPQAFSGLKKLEFISLSLEKNGARGSFDFTGSSKLRRIQIKVPDDFILDPEIFVRNDHLVTLEVHGGVLADKNVQKRLKAFNLSYFQIP